MESKHNATKHSRKRYRRCENTLKASKTVHELVKCSDKSVYSKIGNNEYPDQTNMPLVTQLVVGTSLIFLACSAEIYELYTQMVDDCARKFQIQTHQIQGNL